ncbi:MAG: hypothetical protein A2201_06125 [Alicyclobacillus sp. RIFOXYA1_FULL_53_8]|nr:MAG: hypothetical protein A2201_06125 [Alicyclobacillus sp. RIFOXYA1_FULL_53_8]
MRHDYLTPHQFEPVIPYMDTLLVSTYSPQSLDVAAPHAASRMIAESLTQRILERFGGRTAHLSYGGAALYSNWSAEWAAGLLALYAHPTRFCLVITDRLRTQEWSDLPSSDDTQWAVFDWWQWLRRRVPENRQSDALLFLCQATDEFARSDERTWYGMTPDVLSAMATEGKRLFGEMTADLGQHILGWWQTVDSPDEGLANQAPRGNEIV